MPICFWNDPDGAKYRAALLEHFPGVWRHGDWAEITPQHGMIIYGRSDATLNPGGVRIARQRSIVKLRPSATLPKVSRSARMSMAMFASCYLSVCSLIPNGANHSPIRSGRLFVGIPLRDMSLQRFSRDRYPADRERQDHRACHPRDHSRSTGQ